MALLGVADVALIGAGNIGGEAYLRTSQENWIVSPVIDIDGTFLDFEKNLRFGESDAYVDLLSSVDLAFLTIPTFDTGETARDYILSFTGQSIPIVTSEKGALAYHFAELEEVIANGLLGYSAAVGGGSRMIPYLRDRGSNNLYGLHGVLNGTVNYL